MRTGTFRGRALWGLALLLAFVGGPTGPAGVLHLALDARSACAGVAGEDGSRPAAAAADWLLNDAPEHCGTCHGLCSLRYQVPPLAALSLPTEPLGTVAVASHRPLDAVARLTQPARAPPAALA